MGWQEEYKKKFVDIESAVRRISSDNDVIVALLEIPQLLAIPHG